MFLVLTARHCLANKDLKKTDIRLVKGKENRFPEPVSLDKSNYNVLFPDDIDIDLALIKFEDSFKFSEFVSSIALPKSNVTHPEERDWVTAVGWGLVCDDPPECTTEKTLPPLLQARILYCGYFI